MSNSHQIRTEKRKTRVQRTTRTKKLQNFIFECCAAQTILAVRNQSIDGYTIYKIQDSEGQSHKKEVLLEGTKNSPQVNTTVTKEIIVAVACSTGTAWGLFSTNFENKIAFR